MCKYFNIMCISRDNLIAIKKIVPTMLSAEFIDFFVDTVL